MIEDSPFLFLNWGIFTAWVTWAGVMSEPVLPIWVI